jgi:hypothetical protein
MTNPTQLDSIPRAGTLLSVFSQESVAGIINAVLASPQGVKAAAAQANENSSGLLAKGFGFLDHIPQKQLVTVLVGAIACMRESRSTMAIDSGRATAVATYFGLDKSIVSAAMPSGEALETLAKAAIDDATKRAALASAKRLSHAAAAIQPSVRSAAILPFFYYLGQALLKVADASEITTDAVFYGAEMGDATALEGDEFKTLAAKEVGDVFEEGDADETGDEEGDAMDTISGAIFGLPGVIASKAAKAFKKKKKKKRIARRKKVKRAVAAHPRLEQDIGVAATTKEPAAVQAADEYVEAVQDEPESIQTTDSVDVSSVRDDFEVEPKGDWGGAA